MRSRDARLQVDTLFVLGAGATYSLSHLNTIRKIARKDITPLDKDFLSCINESNPKKGWKNKSTNILSSDWLDRRKFRVILPRRLLLILCQ